MVQLRQFHLHFALTSPGALGKNIENQCGAIENLTLKHLLQITPLRRAEFLVEHHGIDLGFLALFSNLLRLARPDERRRVEFIQPLRASPNDLAPGRRDQFRQLIERFINAPGVLRLELHPNEKHPLGLAIDSVD